MRQRKLRLPPPPNAIPRPYLFGGYIITTAVIKRFARAFVPHKGDKLKDVKTEDFFDCKYVLERAMDTLNVKVEPAQEEGQPLDNNSQLFTTSHRLEMPPSQRKLVLPPRPPGSIHRYYLYGGYIITTEVVKRFARAFVANAGPKLKNVKTKDSLDCMDVVEWAMGKIGVKMEQAEEGGNPFSNSAKWILVTKRISIDGRKGMPLPGRFKEGHTKQEEVLRAERTIVGYFNLLVCTNSQLHSLVIIGHKCLKCKLPLPPRPPGSIPRYYLYGGYIITTEVVKRLARAFVLNAGPKLKNVKTRDSLDCMDVVEWAAAKIGARMEQAEEGADPFRSSAKWILVTKWRRIDGWKGMPLPGRFKEGHTEHEEVLQV
ncbi:hypothetical protein C8Q75DRAFT_811483 [Abortiporus biennis]|nr:hypothetical protein C8Q75DRAFT_811483 [Abortiporus biennis]